KKLIGNDTQTVVIAGLDRTTLRLLWSHIFRRADADTGLGQLIWTREDTRNAKVGQHQRLISAKQHIGRFYIAMNDTLRMSIVDGLCCLHKVCESLGLWHTFLPGG